MKYSTLIPSALIIAGLAALAGTAARADNMASIAITPATGAVTLTPHWAIGGNLAGFHHMSQDLGLTGSVANNFYSIIADPIPDGGNILAFNFYVAGSGSATPHADIGSKLTPNSYSALTSADPDVGYGSVNFYLIHHKGTTDYFTAIIPGSATSSAVTDEKPMSGPGGPDTVTGVSGYFGLTFAASNLGYGLNNFYYLRNDPDTGTVKFGTLAPALLGLSADRFDIGAGGFNTLAFTGADVGYGVDKMYYTRLDPITGYTILGMLDPALAGVRHTSDIANLGSVYNTLTFVPGDVGYGANRFYTTGSINSDAQTVSFAAIADRDTGAGSFTVNPTASSALPITLTVVSGSVGDAIISAPVGGVFTVTPTAPGLITLQATQAGALAPIAYAYNMLRQSFTIGGTTLLGITTQPIPQSVATGGTVNLAVVADGSSTVTYQWRKDGIAILLNASATTDTLTLTNAQASDGADYDVVVTNDSGSITSDAVTLTVTPPPPPGAPVITNSPLTAMGTVHTAFAYTITASNSPTSFNASPLPAGLSINTATGVISGIPAAAGTFFVEISATNITDTGTATLTLTVANTIHVVVQSPLDPVISLTPDGLPPAPGTVYYVKGLPAGLVLDPATGEISTIPGSNVSAKPGTYVVTYYTITTNEDGSKTKGPLLTVRFTVDPLPAGLSGGFESIVELFPAPNSPEGKVELLVSSSTGAFTGKLTHSSQAKPFVFKGVLSAASDGLSGTGSVTIKRGGGNSPFRLDFLIDSQTDADQVLLASLQQLDGSGNVVETVAESDSGVQLVRFSKSSPAPWQGNYTLVLSDPTDLPVDMGVTLAPEGTGFGRIAISSASGLLVVNGTLGDGTPVTASLSPSADGSYRWYVKPYKTGGFLGGWTQFTPVAGSGAPYEVATSANSELYWAKNASSGKDKSYRAGFGPVVIVATAQRWITPAAGTTLSALLQLSDSMVASTFTSDELPSEDALLVPSSLGLNDLNKFVVLSPAANSSGFTAKARAFDGKFTRTNGLFTGSLTLQDGRKVPVNGVFLQQPVVGPGSVIGEGLFVIPPATRGAEAVTGKVQFLVPGLAP